MKHRVCTLILAVAAMSSTAWADILPPDQAACSSSRAGDRCAFDGGACGVPAACGCADKTCTRYFVYSSCPDAGDAGDAAPLGADAACTLVDASTSYACLVCEPGVPTRDGGDAEADAAAADATVPTDGGAEKGDGAVAPPGGGGGGCSCSLESVSAVRGVVPWLLAALVPLALRRRRR